MRVLVCGGRDFTDYLTVYRELNRLAADSLTRLEIIEGGQRTKNEHGQIIGGADYWAHVWAIARGFKCRTFKADWNKYGKAAGPIRNKQMIEEGKPQRVIAFPGGKGTANMISQAEAHGISVIRVEIPA